MNVYLRRKEHRFYHRYRPYDTLPHDRIHIKSEFLSILKVKFKLWCHIIWAFQYYVIYCIYIMHIVILTILKLYFVTHCSWMQGHTWEPCQITQRFKTFIINVFISIIYVVLFIQTHLSKVPYSEVCGHEEPAVSCHYPVPLSSYSIFLFYFY